MRGTTNGGVTEGGTNGSVTLREGPQMEEV